MTFWDKFKNSIYGPEFYKGLKAKPLSFSFKYFYALALILAAIGTLQVSSRIIPGMAAFLTGISSGIVDNYPSELTITIKDGQASSNVAEPYFIKMPDSVRSEKSANVPNPANLIVIDTKNQFTEENFAKYDTVALLTKTSVAFRKDNGGIEIYSLGKIPNWTIDKTSIASFMGKVQPFIKFVAPLLVAAIFIGLMIAFSAQLIYLLFAALLIWIVVKVKKLPLGYKRSYQVGLHAITLPLLLGVVSNIFSMQNPIPFFSTILLVAVAFINFEPKKNDTASS